jgi:hypothetical protein
VDANPQFPYILRRWKSVSFPPREKINLRDGTEEIAARQKSSEVFFNDKAAAKVKTAYGLEHSPHYMRKSRQQNAALEGRATEDMGSKTP